MIPVVHEDERFVAVNKPTGQLVIPGRGAPEPTLKEAAESRAGARLFVVHRLDREASGLVLFAKDAETHRKLCALFETRRIRKTYLAAVQGEVASDGTVDQPLREFGSGRMGVAEKGKPSLTSYRVKERLRGATLLEVEPSTGRRHQIRVHLCAAGHPILGDPLYGKDRPVGGAPRLMLHAWKLAFELEGRPLALEAEPPEEFLAALARFRA